MDESSLSWRRKGNLLLHAHASWQWKVERDTCLGGVGLRIFTRDDITK